MSWATEVGATYIDKLGNLMNDGFFGMQLCKETAIHYINDYQTDTDLEGFPLPLEADDACCCCDVLPLGGSSFDILSFLFPDVEEAGCDERVEFGCEVEVGGGVLLR